MHEYRQGIVKNEVTLRHSIFLVRYSLFDLLISSNKMFRLLASLICCVLLLMLTGCANEPAETTPTESVAATYVGNTACAGCHEDIYASYIQTGMGRSVTPFDPATAPESFDGQPEVYNARFDYYYAPVLKGDTLYQREYRKDDEGNIIHERMHAAEWVIGSGNATRSYLMNVNGHVTQMPLTWYVEKEQWDMSPAYEQQNFRFERPIGEECMTCHNGLPEFSPYSQNHFDNVPLGISCERCHGPGSEHVALRLAGLGPDDGGVDASIVNPEHLSRDLQLSVCQQCHLTGTTVLAVGEEMDSFKPGELLAAHRSVFVIEEQVADPESFGIASHAQRLARSACFEQSEMTCVTCHNPHEPVASLGEDAFNAACIGCHTPADGPDVAMCSREDFPDPAEAMTGNCVGCHLQKSGTSDIPHVTFTDHWIRRTLPPARAPEDIDRDLVQRTPFELVRLEANDAVGSGDDLLEQAIAYFNFYDTEHRHAGYLPIITQRVRAGQAAGADHPEARLVMARALFEQDSLTAAQRVLDEAILAYPAHARLHFWLGEVKQRRQDFMGAIRAFDRSASLAPAFLQAKMKLASAYSNAQQLDAAEQTLLEVVAENPVHLPDAWNNLGFVYLQTQRLAEASEMFDRAIALDPDLATAWANAGTVHLMTNAFDEAAVKFEQALRADPAYIPALGNLSLVYRQQGRIEEAKEMLRRLLTFQPGDPNAAALLRELEAL